MENPTIGWPDKLAAIAYVICIFSGLCGIIKPIRLWCGLLMRVASFAIGLDIWLWSIRIVHELWGNFMVGVGILMAGIGIAPLALLATAFHGDWVMFIYLAINLGFLFLFRFIASKFTGIEPAAIPD